MKLSISALSEITGFDRRTIKNRLAELKPEIKQGGHYYDTQKALPILFETNSKAELARLAHFKANNEELKENRLQNDLIKADEVITNWNLLQDHFTRNCLPIPPELIEALAQSNNINQCCAIVTKHIHDVLLSISSASIEQVRDEKL